MKVVFVGNGFFDMDNYPFPNQGGSVQTWGISRELAKRGHEVSIIRRSVQEGEETIQDVTLVGIKFKAIENIIHAPFLSVFWHIPRPFSSIRFSKRSLKHIQKINPDVICLIHRFSGLFPSKLKMQKIFIMHSPDALDFFKPYVLKSNKLNSINFFIQKSIERDVLLNVNKIVALNSYIESYLRRTGFCNIVKIPNGINHEDFINDGDNGYVLYAGKFDWNKNVGCLVQAFAKLMNKYPRFRLFLVGSGPTERKLREIINEKRLNSQVMIIPWLPRKKLFDLMSHCSILVLPSFYEAANPVVVLEAMASGKPVIARTNMGTVDIIQHGINGYLFNSENELTRILGFLLSDNKLRARIGFNARKLIEEKYSFTKIASEYEKLFYSMLD